MNEVKNWRGIVVGYRCSECGGIFTAMWGDICNGCRATERRHKELIAAISKSAEDKNHAS